MRRKRLETPPATLAGEMLAVYRRGPGGFGLIVAGISDVHHAFSKCKRVFHAAGDARAGVGPDGQAIDKHLDVVFAAPVDGRGIVQRISLPVHAHSDIAQRSHFLPNGFVALADVDFPGGHDVDLRAGGMIHDLGDDFVGRLGADGQVAGRAMRHAQSGDENPQVIVDFGYRADRAAGRVPAVLLLDGDGGRKALDVVEPGFLHLGDELPGVSAEAFDVAALTLGINGVHGQRTFARSAGPAADGKLIAGDIDVDALEVVLFCAADLDELCLF